MKKGDFLIISFILILIVILGLVFSLNNKTKEYSIELVINNEYIDTIDINDDCEYEIKSIDKLVYIYKNNILIKTIESKKDIYNKIVVKNQAIEMTDANCEGKDCTMMHLSKQYLYPIICTNNVVIKVVYKNQNADIII